MRGERSCEPSDTCLALEPELTACADACARLEEIVALFESGDPSTFQARVKRDYVVRFAAYQRAKSMLNRKSAHLARVGLRESLTLVRERAMRDGIMEKRALAKERQAAPLDKPGAPVGKKRWASMAVFPIEVSRMRRLGDV